MIHTKPDALEPARAYVAAMRAAGYGLQPWGDGYLVTLPQEIEMEQGTALALIYQAARNIDPDFNQKIRAALIEEDRA